MLVADQRTALVALHFAPTWGSCAPARPTMRAVGPIPAQFTAEPVGHPPRSRIDRGRGRIDRHRRGRGSSTAGRQSSGGLRPTIIAAFASPQFCFGGALSQGESPSPTSY